ncbi:1,4-alpha-glucan branching enzyme [Desulfonatronum thiosulfatophilum]|uniref:1,4-alpha-glucan branching enzyme GlgB n=1 Tax=Desulfonatronum thiosulfatophilum TaxID=617002 RepID=A0A1G6DI19_9BACT|nr:1,4-alpha-glucan branching protein GlgB [Desulfonatronum thiosulfatophilum]SDB44768.1 1,4-alpha-glucan branching enzyme [Desulfonatronum thiosulfatophilum]
MKRVIPGVSLFSEEDIYLFREGRHFRLYDKLGSHPMEVDGEQGTLFAVWAPNAEQVSVIGDFNGWDNSAHVLHPRWDGSGIWEGFIPGAHPWQLYKYHIRSRHHMYSSDRADPFARHTEIPPNTSSVVWDLEYQWNDGQWMHERALRNSLRAPQSVYEVHLGSWQRIPGESNRFLTYREMASRLPAYVREMGFTHVELLPVMEHPFYGSWGYQTLGYFAPTSRFGPPQDFMYLVDQLHQNGIGVILDWVPSHFPGDGHGLAYFDGTHLYEHSDPRQGYHPDWNSYIFNYGRNEVRCFLISSALFWLDKYHVDGLRVDAVASMLYLDYSRKEGEWIPNRYGGRENMEAIEFIRAVNEAVYVNFPDTQTAAEESTAWPMVSRPTDVGGLGFGMKWNMGWMHDTLSYMANDPIHRQYHHNQLTFSIWYSFAENFILPMSHDEVVYGKGSLLNKMPGDYWQKCANLRLLFGYMYGHPGKKLLFMGGEFGQWSEWAHEQSLQWHLLHQPEHHGVQRWVQDLNKLYRGEPALYEMDFEQDGFSWVDCNDADQSVISFLRRGSCTQDLILVAANFTPVPRENYRVGVPRGGIWREILNSDAREYGGSGMGNMGGVEAAPLPSHNFFSSLALTLPPLGVVFLKSDSTGNTDLVCRNELFADIPETPTVDFFLKKLD